MSSYFKNNQNDTYYHYGQTQLTNEFMSSTRTTTGNYYGNIPYGTSNNNSTNYSNVGGAIGCAGSARYSLPQLPVYNAPK